MPIEDIALEPIAVFCDDVLSDCKTLVPTATLLWAVVFAPRDDVPIATFAEPDVMASDESLPIAILLAPVVIFNNVW